MAGVPKISLSLIGNFLDRGQTSAEPKVLPGDDIDLADDYDKLGLHYRGPYIMKATSPQQWKGAARFLKLTTKMANKGFYKGTGSGSTGRHTKHGGYVIEWEKVRTYVVPKNLKDFNVCQCRFCAKRVGELEEEEGVA